MPANRNTHLETLIANTAAWQIEFRYAIQMLAGYMRDLESLQNGIPFSELGYKEKRQRQQSYLLSQGGKVLGFSGNDTPTIHQLPNTHQAPITAVIPITGVLTMQGTLSHRPAKDIAADIHAAFDSEAVEQVILEVNSGGGETIAGSIIQNAVAEKNKPVFAIAHLATSAAYKAILPADKILASTEESIIGSIGTMVSLDKRELDEYQKNIINIYAKSSPDKNRELREILSGNYIPLLERLDKVDAIFMDQVVNHRPLNAELKEETLRGGIWSAKESMQRGLIDGMGTIRSTLKQRYTTINAQAPAQPGTFLNQNHFSMKLLKQLQAALRGKGYQIPEEADEQATVDAIEQHELQGVSLEQFNALEQSILNIQEVLEGLESSGQDIAGRIEAAEGILADMRAENQTLSEDVVSIKAKYVNAEDGNTNQEAPNADQFNTVQQTIGQPPGEAKY